MLSEPVDTEKRREVIAILVYTAESFYASRNSLFDGEFAWGMNGDFNGAGEDDDIYVRTTRIEEFCCRRSAVCLRQTSKFCWATVFVR